MPDEAAVEVDGEDGRPPEGPHAACGGHEALSFARSNKSAVIGEHVSDVLLLTQEAGGNVVAGHD